MRQIGWRSCHDISVNTNNCKPHLDLPVLVLFARHMILIYTSLPNDTLLRICLKLSRTRWLTNLKILLFY